MKSFILSLALFANQILASGGGGGDTGSTLDKVLDFGDGTVAPIRMKDEHEILGQDFLSNTKP